MKSMTGYGRIANLDAELEVVVKSVNSRYLDTRFHLPRDYMRFDSDLKGLVASMISRGTVDIYVNRTGLLPKETSEVVVNTELARQWVDSYRLLARELNFVCEPSLELLTQVPEIMKVVDTGEVSENEKKVVFTMVEQALMACDTERSREGLALQKALLEYCHQLEELGVGMEALTTEANSELEQRFRTRLHKLGGVAELDEQRLAQEIVIHLDRSDIAEEMSRLREHLKAYRKILGGQGPQGKKLDFYAQELLREVNTIGSKSHIAKLTELVVDAKTLVEKIRELVQNVE